IFRMPTFAQNAASVKVGSLPPSDAAQHLPGGRFSWRHGRPIPNFSLPLGMLRRGPPNLPFAAGAKIECAKLTAYGQCCLSFKRKKFNASTIFQILNAPYFQHINR
ncbi:MAG: hypothetical protein AAFN76_12435, partial [Pseudomonadota bacterium]